MSNNTQFKDIGQANEQQAMLGTDELKPSIHTTHPEAQWFPKAGLGLFVHWGLASVHGNADLSWSMIANTTWDKNAKGSNKLTPNQYWGLAKDFKPDQYDPDKWLSAAAKAGFKYAVLTTMHHDGYTLWPSSVGECGVHTHLPDTDLVGPFVEACRKNGLKVGLYYSPPDWHFEKDWMSFDYNDFAKTPVATELEAGTQKLDTDWKPAPFKAPPIGHAEERKQRFHKRVEELLTNYGPIDLLWFDGGAYDNEIRDRARELQPHIVINTRSCDGDFDHTECELPQNITSTWFETCHCWQSCDIPRPNGNMLDVWGYLDSETYKSSEWLIETYGYLKAKGANLLVNVGPRPNGELPDIVYERFNELEGKL